MPAESKASHLQTQTHGAIRTLLLNRPEKKNALTYAMYAALTNALQEAEQDAAISVVVLGSTSSAFTAGNDIGDFLSGMQSPDDWPALSPTDAPVMLFLRALSTFSKFVVAAVDGAAVGIGTTLLLHCDCVLASDKARFKLAFVNLALVPEGASTVLLPAVIGLRRASAWMLSDDTLDAKAALDAGLVNAVVPAEHLLSQAMVRAEAMAKLPQRAARATKQLLREPLKQAVADALEHEARVFAQQLTTPEAAKAFHTFQARTKHRPI